MDFGSQNAMKFGAKSNPIGTSGQKGTCHVYTTKTNEFSMFSGIKGVDFEQQSVQNGSKIEVEIRASFFVDFL